MSVAITVVALDAHGVVLRTRIVPPSRIFFAPRARWIVELPVGAAPEPGDRANAKIREGTGNG